MDNSVTNRREGVAEEMQALLSDRTRYIAAAAIAVTWGLLAGESKIGALRHDLRLGLIIAGGLGVGALVFDYFESLFEFLDATYSGGSFLGLGRRTMFVGKQVIVLGSALLLLLCAFLIVTRTPEATATSKVGIWTGEVWDNQNTNAKRPSELHLSVPDPNTGSVTAKKDDIDCKGWQTGDTLILVCDSIALKYTGSVQPEKNYQGTWSATDQRALAGGFSYTFRKWWSK